MSREAVGVALNAMADEEVRDQIAGGDLSALGEVDLTDVEREVLIGAAEDYPEVSGFSFSTAFNFSAAPPQQLRFEDHGRFGQAAHHAFGSLAGSAALHINM